jgi:hypothetical protein
VDHQEPRFAIEYCAPNQAAGTIILRTGDPNAATAAFHSALSHLSQQGHKGAVDLIVLRQPIAPPAPPRWSA